MKPSELPIYSIEAELRAAVAANPVVVVEGPTGSGKTTQLPQILYRSGLGEFGVLGVTQPRRIAAVSVATRIAEELGSPVGELAGYKIRFADETNPSTRIKIMTDGILLQEQRYDPLLSQYALIMVDEAHERSLNIDFTLGLLKRILPERRDLRVIVSSATLNAERFCSYFDDAPLVRLDVAPFPVDVSYLRRDLPGDDNAVVEAAVRAVERLLTEESEGHILVFLPGEASILDCCERVRGLRHVPAVEVLPLFGRLSKDEQDRVFSEYAGRRKVVVATNIAETSLTIEGIRAVVDSGLAKVVSFNHRTGVGVLTPEPVSRASCDQRRGRAGRTGPGRCLRLFSKRSYAERPLYATEEILRIDLSEVVLRMLALGVKDIERFDFLTSPDPRDLLGALELLQRIGAVTDDRRLSAEGRVMIELPLEPRVGRMLVEAMLRTPDVLREVATIAAFLSTRTPFVLGEGDPQTARAAHAAFADDRGDFHTFLSIFRQYRRAPDTARFCRENFLDERILREVGNIREQLLDLATSMGYAADGGGHWSHILRAVARGFPMGICRRDPRNAGYRSAAASGIFLHPGSALFSKRPECFVAAEIVRTARTFARSCGRLDPKWLAETAPDVYEQLFGRGRARRTTREEAPQPPAPVIVDGRAYPVRRVRDSLVVTFPWDAVEPVAEALRAGNDVAVTADPDVRAEILLEEGPLLRGARVLPLLRALPFLRVDEGVLERWPRDDLFTLDQRLAPLFRHLSAIFRVVRAGGARSKLGFLTFCANFHGGYWYQISHELADAAVTSAASLEALQAEVHGVATEEEIEAVEEALKAARLVEEALVGRA